MNWDFTRSTVIGIYGELGGGKTLTAVEMMVSALRQGHRVCSNVRLKNLQPHLLPLYDYQEDIMSADPWAFPCGSPRGSSGRKRAIICIDEISENFDQYSGQASKNFLSWLRHSSKRGQTVIMISQRPEFMAKPLRLLVALWVVALDFQSWRMPFLKIHVPFMGGFVGRNLYDRQGNLISTGFNIASKREIGYYYDTSQSIALLGKDEDSPEEETIYPFSPWFFKIVAAWLVASLFYFGH